GPAQFLESLYKRRKAGGRSGVVGSHIHQDANSAPPLRLLRARRERPRGRAAEQRDENAPLHSITSSASASNLSGIWSPSALAVFRLITNSYFVGACT